MVKVKCSPADIVECSREIKNNNLSEVEIQNKITALIEQCSPVKRLPPVKVEKPPSVEEFTPVE